MSDSHVSDTNENEPAVISPQITPEGGPGTATEAS